MRMVDRISCRVKCIIKVNNLLADCRHVAKGNRVVEDRKSRRKSKRSFAQRRKEKGNGVR